MSAPIIDIVQIRSRDLEVGMVVQIGGTNWLSIQFIGHNNSPRVTVACEGSSKYHNLEPLDLVNVQREVQSVDCATPDPKGDTVSLAQFGHHPDPIIDAEVEVDSQEGRLAECYAVLRSGLDLALVSPAGVAFKRNIRDLLATHGQGLYAAPLGGNQ